jgi:hypothetical protein
VERDEKPGSVSWTGIMGQPLLPGETPMRALGASQDVLRSFQSIGARGSDGGSLMCVGEPSEGEEKSGQNTALTRRGLIVAVLS